MNTKEATKIKNNLREIACINSHITVLDNTVAVIENCKQILECNEILAKIQTGKFEVEVWGSGLMLSNYCSEYIEIRGKISSINIHTRKDRE